MTRATTVAREARAAARNDALDTLNEVRHLREENRRLVAMLFESGVPDGEGL